MTAKPPPRELRLGRTQLVDPWVCRSVSVSRALDCSVLSAVFRRQNSRSLNVFAKRLMTLKALDKVMQNISLSLLEMLHVCPSVSVYLCASVSPWHL